MKSSIVTCFMALLLCITVSSQETKPIELIVSIPDLGEKEFIVGEAISVQVTLKNTSSGPIYILPPLDGSAYGRYPRYTQTVIRPLPVDSVSDGLICGTFNPLRLEDFVLLQVGESYILPYPYFSWKPYTAGEYEVSLPIDFNGTPEQYRGASIGDSTTVAPELLEKLNQVPKVEIESNRVKLNVVSNGKTLDPRVHCLMGMTREEFLRLFPAAEQRGFDASISWIVSRGIVARVHFNNSEKVDGVRIENYMPDWTEEYLMWARGYDSFEPESWYKLSIYENNDCCFDKYMIDVGYFEGRNLSTTNGFDLYK